MLLTKKGESEWDAYCVRFGAARPRLPRDALAIVFQRRISWFTASASDARLFGRSDLRDGHVQVSDRCGVHEVCFGR